MKIVFLFLVISVVYCQADFSATYTSFKDKAADCELKLFGVFYFKGLNDIVTEDVKIRKRYVDDKSLYTSGKHCNIFHKFLKLLSSNTMLTSTMDPNLSKRTFSYLTLTK